MPAESNDEGIVVGAPGSEARSFMAPDAAGWSSLFLGAVVVGLLVYLVVFVVAPMTQPSPVFDKVLGRLEQEVNKPGVNETTIDLLVLLEYTNAGVRTIGVQVAFSLVAGVVLVAVGILLFAVGAQGTLRVRAQQLGNRFVVGTEAPGLAAIIAGAVLVGIGVWKDPAQPIEAQVSRALGVHTVSDQHDVRTNVGRVVGVDKDQLPEKDGDSQTARASGTTNLSEP